jgi:hypothetical protein
MEADHFDPLARRAATTMRRTLLGLGCGNRPRDADRRSMITRTRTLMACVPAATTTGLAASIAAPAMATTPTRELTVTSATDSDYQAGNPYFRDSSEKDHSMASRAGSDGAVRLEEGVIGMLRKLSRKARGIHHGPF